MKIQQISILVDEVAREVLEFFLSNACLARQLEYVSNKLSGDFTREFCHCGLYGFRLSKDRRSAIAYVGKSVRGGRLRDHLTCLKRNGELRSTSNNNKYKVICDALEKGYGVDLCLYQSDKFNKSSLSAIEISAQEAALIKFSREFPEVSPWIKRI